MLYWEVSIPKEIDTSIIIFTDSSVTQALKEIQNLTVLQFAVNSATITTSDN